MAALTVSCPINYTCYLLANHASPWHAEAHQLQTLVSTRSCLNMTIITGDTKNLTETLALITASVSAERNFRQLLPVLSRSNASCVSNAKSNTMQQQCFYFNFGGCRGSAFCLTLAHMRLTFV